MKAEASRTRQRAVQIAMFAAAVAGPGALAQQAVIEEIIVTAQKREQRLQDTPVSVTAFTAEAIEARSMLNLQDINAFTPNMEINAGRPDGGASSASIYIRGAGQSDFLFPNDPGVGLYVDGVYMGRTIGGLMGLSDLERVEVLRGPQGTLWGRNTIGGAVNLVTRKPGDEVEFDADITIGSFDRVDGRVSVNLPASEQFAVRASYAALNADGYGEQLLTGRDTGDENKDIVRVQALWEPDESVEVLSAFDYTRVDENNWAGTLLARKCVPGVGTLVFASFATCQGLMEGLYNSAVIPFPPGVIPGYQGKNAELGLAPDSRYDSRWVTDSPYDSNGTDPVFVDNEIWGASLTATWEVNSALTLKSITAYRETDAAMARDGDHTPYRIVWTNDTLQQDQVSEELTLSGLSFGERLRWVAGVFYFTEDGQEDNLVFIADGTCDFADAAFGPGACAALGLDINFDIHNEIDVDAWAGFGQGTWEFNDQWSLTVGLRYSWENKEYFQDHLLQDVFDTAGNQVNYVGPRTLEEDWDAFTPKFGLDWRVTEDALVYFSAARGFKSGGWSPRPTSGNEGRNPFDPEFMWSYELGAKTGWLDNRLTLNVAGFYNDYSDIQVTTIASRADPVTGAPTLVLNVENVGDAEVYGFELEAFALPTERLQLQLGVGYMHNEYTSINTGVTIPKDSKLVETPPWTLNLGVQYTFPLGSLGQLILRGDGAYRDKTYKDPYNLPELTQGDYWLLNARATWISPDEHWQLAVFGRNITDEEYLTNGLHEDIVGALEGYFGRPAEWGMTLSYRY